MKCTRQIDWVRYTLEFETHEMQAIITRMGWSITDSFAGMTKDDQRELYRLEYELNSVYAYNDPLKEHKDWFFSHVIHQENAHAMHDTSIQSEPIPAPVIDTRTRNREQSLDALIGE